MFIEPIYKDALVFSSLLSLLSLGLTLTFLTTRIPNFAHGCFATVGIYVALTVHKVFKADIYYGLPLAFLLTGFLALLQYLVVLKPLSRRRASVITLMVATIALELILLAVLNIYADYLARTFKISSRYFQLRGADFQLAGERGLLFVAPSLVAITTLLLHLALTKTKFGVAMRATIENPDLASALGINADLVYKVSWFLAGGLAGLAGGLLPLWFIGNPDTGDYMLVSIFAASVTGGLFSIYGGLFGGFFVGFVEVLGTGKLALSVGTWIIPYRPIIPLLAMVITLLIAPRGITGIMVSRVRFKWIRVWRWTG
ncbi:MAG: branched-chain amino acid ABC transporter permease [Candidatus Nezhaarchaeales archaeon]